MLTILSITAPIYLIIGGGFLCVRSGLFEKRDTRVLGRFVANFALPALLFQALSTRSFADILNGRYLVAYGVASLAVFFGAMGVIRELRHQPLQKASMQALGMSSSNSAYIGYPIASQLLGPQAAVGLAMVMLIENLIMVPLALGLAEGAETGARSISGVVQALKGLLRNPMIVAILVGLVVSAFGIEVPDVLARTVRIVAAAASPVALFVIGGTLVGLELHGVRKDVTAITLGKLLLHPFAVMVFVWLLSPIDPTLRAAAVVYAAVPMLSIYPVVAQRFHLEELCAAALLATTTASFVTISVWLWLMHAVLGWTA